MCAITGILGLPYSEGIITAMLSSMARRGPDGSGVAMTAGVCLLHTRLAIIDPEGGQQPMKLNWQGKHYTLVYNGELYNTAQLRQELEKLGHTFETLSDTEVLLHAYVQWQEGCLSRLNGIFAFAVHCRQTGQVFLARDPMGVKPLFYMMHKGGLLFASELKTILCYPQVPRQLDAEGAAQLLLLGPGRIPGSGVLRGIRELEPGYWGLYDGEMLHLHCYWSLKDREHTDSFPETVEKVRQLVVDSIERQTVADVPIGTFLSGGLDSSLITAVCANGVPNGPLPTFSLDFQNNDRYFVPGYFQPESDNSYITLMREHFSTDHHWTVLTPEQLLGALEQATVARDLPGMADVDFSLLLFCREISQHVKVALSGECADEIFGGYPWYRDPRLRDSEGFPWSQNIQRRQGLLHPRYTLDGRSFVGDLYADTIARCDILPGTSAEDVKVKQMVNLNQRWFMQTLLDRKDRMSMYSGLEVRVPFCDHRIAQYLYGVPWKFKDYRDTEKGLLRKAMEGYLPQQVLWRKKSPYPKTYDPRYLQLVAQQLKLLLQNKQAPIHSLVRKEALEELMVCDPEQPWYGQLMKQPQTIAYMLQLNFWLEHYGISVL